MVISVRAVLATASAALLLPLVAPPAPASAASPTPPAGTSVTLITGDVVTVRSTGADGGTVDVRRPDGTPAAVHVVESGSKLYVFPLAAMPLVADGLLDRALFDVTGLIADGYDDAHTAHLPLIVRYADGLLPPAAPAGSTRVRSLPAVHGAALTEDRARATDFWSSLAGGPGGANSRAPGSAITKVWLDGKVHADLAESTAQIGAPSVWAGGDTGSGVTVAVLDTGVDPGHPDLAGQIDRSSVFVPGADLLDRAGHGTHVASTIAGTGAASGGVERGVAPGARLDVGKVLGDDGSGQDSWILAGMQWAAVDAGAKIISMSLGSTDPSDGTDPLSEAVDTLSAQTGALFVIAAGNAGAPSTVSSPGAASAALTVGAVDADDQLAYFSSQGPRLSDQAIKPELTAPGVDISAARSQYTAEGSGSYLTLSGTSMATPHVAGAAALLLSRHPSLTGAQLKDALVTTTKPTPGLTPFQGGTGRVDVAAAVATDVFATGTVNVAATGGTVVKTVTYTNIGTAARTLRLSISGDVPAGLLTLGATGLTVPAHGTATATVTVDTAKAGTGGPYAAQIVADGDAALRTAIEVGKVVPYHTMTLRITGRDGSPMAGTVELLGEGQPDPWFVDVDATGVTNLLLPDGLYSAMAFVNVSGSHGPNSLGLALVGNPDVDLRRNATVALDARHLSRVQATTPKPAGDTYDRLEYYRTLPGTNPWRSFVEGGVFYDSFWAQPTAKVKHGDFYFAARWRKEQPELSVTDGTTNYDDVVRQLSETPLPAGTDRWSAVYAGTGTAAEYVGLNARGKVVVVRHDLAVRDADQAAAAVAAGAAMLLVVNDNPWREQRRYSADPLAPAPIEVALLSTDEGNALIAAIRHRRVTLTVASTPVSDYVYDLMEVHHDSIPGHLVQVQNAGNLAQVRVGFDQPQPPSPGGEFRFDWPVYSDWGIGTLSSRRLAPRRTDWISTGALNQWGQEAYIGDRVYEIDDRQAYAPRSTGTEQFFAPIERPHLNNNYKPPTRTGNSISVDIPGWGSGDHVGMAQNAATQTTAVYQGDTLLGQSGGTFVTVAAPSAKSLGYRVVVKTAEEPGAWPYSSSTTTTWSFRSAAPATTAVLPLLQLEYAVAGDDLTVSSDTKATPIRLSVSYDDGAHWTAQPLSRAGTARLRPPRQARFASIRATATDPAGNAIDQTVIRAFGLG
jgi:subtilisin family serine protease